MQPIELPSYSEERLKVVKETLSSVIESNQHEVLIGLDGPVAVGKGWIAEQLSEIFGYHQISNGNIVRAYTWFFIKHFDPVEGLKDGSFDIYVRDHIKVSEVETSSGIVIRLRCQGMSRDLHPESADFDTGLRSPEIERYVSSISPRVPVVDAIRQRVRFAANTSILHRRPFLAEGRDNYKTFEIFPQSLRVLVTASDEVLFERAIGRENKKRQKAGKPLMTAREITALKGTVIDRNKADMNQPYGYGRLLSLAEAAAEPGYHILDTTEFTKEQSLFAVAYLQLLTLSLAPEFSSDFEQKPYQPPLL